MSDGAFTGGHCRTSQLGWKMNSRFLISVYNVLPKPLTAAVVRLVKPTYPIGVVAVVFDEQNRVLLLQHTYHRPAWRLPGGLMEKGETPAAVVVREMMEEANCQVEPLGVIDALHEAHTFDVVVLARLVYEDAFQKSAEICARRWVHTDELHHLSSTHEHFIQRAKDLLDFYRSR